ncbi:MAG: hypothetical protein GC151_07105 [Betaproteobacteria bacterium]|nr:hypothetical protein [Betaproteobacteria bacterium]
MHPCVRRRTFLTALGPLALGACGFQLRGQVSLPFQSVFVAGLPYSPFTSQLKRGIAAIGGTKLADRPADAQAVITLLNENQDRAILTVSAGGRVREQQLRYRVQFRVDGPKGHSWLAPSEVTILRDMTYDDTQVLAKEGEAQTLFREMQSDAVRQVLRRIQAIQAFSVEPDR